MGTKIHVRLFRAIVVPVLLVTALLYPIFELHLQERIKSSHDAGRALLQAEYEALVHDINGSLNHVLAMAEFPSLQRYLIDAQKTLPPYQAQMFERDQGRLQDLFGTWLTHFGSYTRLTLLDRSGEERLSAGRPRHAEAQHEDASYFTQAMTLPPRGVYVSAPYVGASLAGPEISTTLMDLAVPVYSDAGQQLGILLLTLDWRDLMATLPHRRDTDNIVDVLLVDARGRSLISETSVSVPFGSSLAEQWPEAWNAMLGRTRGEATFGDQTLLFLTHDMQAQHYRSQAEQVLGGPQSQPWHLGIVVRRPDWAQLLSENPGQMLVIGMVYLMAIGFGIFWVLSNHHQRSLRGQAEALSMEARQYARDLHDLYENAPCGYHSLDQEGRVVKMNRTELSWLGYSADEVIGERCYRDFTSSGTREAFDAAFEAVLGQGHEGSAECELICRDGTVLPVAIEATAQITEEGFQYSRAMVFDLTERKQLEELLVHQSMTDPLTGLGNRRFLEKQAEIEMARAERSGKPLCLIALDLDHFKRINDTYGHDIGDLVLKEFAKTALDQLREGDVLCRIGGEEFTALLPETSEEQALGVAERLRFAVERAPVFTGETEPLSYTASLGITRIRSDETGLRNAIKRADDALYKAKEGGRNQARLMFDVSEGVR